MPSSTSPETEPLLGAQPAEGDNERSILPGSAAPHPASDRPVLVLKILATLFSFVVLGLIISTPGVILPHLEEHYHLNDVQASLIFLVAPAGYLLGARLNEPIHTRLGQRGVAVIAPVCQVVFTGTILLFHHPQKAGFPLFLVATVVGNVGSGLLDGSWCAWAGGLGGRRTNTIQGLLHGSFSVGAGLGPFLAGTIFTVWEWPWWTWYGVLLGVVLTQGLLLSLAFRLDDGSRYRDSLQALERDESGTVTSNPPETMRILRYPVTWICAVYFLAYVGTESAISGWVVTFMLRARHASPYLASLSSTGFWLGMATGRLALGPVTDHIRVRPATASYLIIAIALQAGLLASSTARHVETGVSTALLTIAGIGFFLGPIFPSGIVVLARALPRELHVGAVSFVASVGQLGAAALPFALGALAQWLGIWVFQGFILALLAGTLLIWLVFPDGASEAEPSHGVTDGRQEPGFRNETTLTPR